MPYQGIPEITLTADPAVNTSITYTFTENRKVLIINFQFITNATAANRQVVITFKDSAGNVYFQTSNSNVQTASVTGLYCAAAGARFNANSIRVMPLPREGLLARKGDIMTISSLLMQATDDFGPAIMQSEQY